MMDKVYFFDSRVAETYGVDNAIVINSLRYWIEHNRANGMHLHDGHTWTYSSLDAFCRIYPFWTKNQVRRILGSLEERGVIIKGNYNSSPYDRTLWYTFTDAFEAWMEGSPMETATPVSPSPETPLEASPDAHPEEGESYFRSVDSHTSIKNSLYNKHTSTNNYNKTDNVKGDPSMGRATPGDAPEVVSTRGTTEGKSCLFADSRFSRIEDFRKCFDGPEFADVDLDYYYHAVSDWSAQRGKKMKDWIATARNWMRRDANEGKLKRMPGNPADVSGGVKLSREALEYLRMMGE